MLEIGIPGHFFRFDQKSGLSRRDRDGKQVCSMHSSIERQTKKDVFTPRDYVNRMVTARKNPAPYEVEQMTYSDFKKLSADYLTTIRPGKVAGDATVSDVRALHYEGTLVQYKLKFSDVWQTMPHRVSKVNPVWENRFQSRLPIKERKFNDLQALKVVMPQSVHSFFDTLPK